MQILSLKYTFFIDMMGTLLLTWINFNPAWIGNYVYYNM